ncbi:phosphotransferase [Agromyces aurantiacus]|uniref:Phosphotransferase n=1 Tax=Agromyces aurantiacus TaxID=165814 RepID=A0ABV9R980_9MICO|nr:phosphotransferase [Agromyces aurantiacus]MBM7505290.1 aminoglycoside phosphotransferase (APT) family kinase protein [Agromyces aurantiacus]
MARPPLTLAALATAAVAGLEVRAARAHTRGAGGAFDAVELHAVDGRRLLIRAPRSQNAESEQSADLVALRALTPGIRSRLPFAVPQYVGQAPIGPTRAIVTEFIPGAMRSADELTANPPLAAEIGRAIAAIHALPAGFVGEAGLPRHTAAEARESVVAVIDRAADTGRLPAALVRRWEEATDDETLWRFAPTVVNGQLGAESFLIEGDRVSGVVGWSGLAVDDPARDLHWLLTSTGAAAEEALAAYVTARSGGADAELARRALLHAELELARWLLHGVDTRDDAVVEDAVGLLDGLVASVHDLSSEPLTSDTGPILAVDEVERLLDETPRDVVGRESGATMLTDSYDIEELRRHLDGEGAADRAEQPAGSPPLDATAPIPLDLSDWGDAKPPAEGNARGRSA